MYRLSESGHFGKCVVELNNAEGWLNMRVYKQGVLFNYVNLVAHYGHEVSKKSPIVGDKTPFRQSHAPCGRRISQQHGLTAQSSLSAPVNSGISLIPRDSQGT
eukprot:2961172-Amphidinium_carterae.1